MKNRLAIFSVSGAALAAAAFAFQAGGNLIAGHASAISKADGLSVRQVAISPTSGRVQTSVEMAKPNFLRIESPTQLVVSDGTDIYTFFKSQNVYTKKSATPAALAVALSSDEFLAVRPFFIPNALASMTSIRSAAAVNRRGQEVTPVSGNFGVGKRATFYIGASDSLARQLELSETGDGKTQSVIVDLVELNLARPAASRFEFKAPSGSREIDEAELNAGKWFTTMNEALAESKRTNKPIMMDLYTDWCHFCKKLDAEVFSTDAFKAKAARFVLLKVNPEKTPDETGGVNAEGFPTVVFMNTSGQEIHRAVGFRPVDMFLSEMDKALEAFGGN